MNYINYKTKSPYETPDATCPYCGARCQAEFVDIGVGMVQCEPYCCEKCGAIEIGPTTTPDRPLTADEERTGWTIAEQQLTPLQQNVRSMFAELVDLNFMAASDHNYRCKCAKCLQWWLTIGPEDTGHGWSFGPFTESEFVAAGGVVPEYGVEEPTFAN